MNLPSRASWVWLWLLAGGLAHAAPILVASPTRVDAPVAGAMPGAQSQPAVASGGGTRVAVWVDGASPQSVRLSRLDSAGKPTDNPAFVVSPVGTLSAPGVAYDGARFLVAWQSAAGGGYDIVGAYFNPAAGTVGLPFDIANGAANQVSPVVISGGTSVLVTWSDPDVKATVFDSTGTATATAVTISATAGANGVSGTFGGGKYLLVWHEPPSPLTVHGRTITPAGATTAAITISDGAGVHVDAAATFDGTSYVVTWSNQAAFELRARRIDTAGAASGASFVAVDGNLLGSGSGAFVIDSQVTFANSQAVAFYGVDDANFPGFPTIYGARFTTATTADGGGGGALVIPYPYLTVKPLPTSATNDARRITTYASGNNATCVWSGYTSGFLDGNVYSTTIDASAGALSAPTAQPLALGKNYQLSRSVATNGSSYLVVWEDNRDLDVNGIELFGLRVGLDGTPIDGAPFLIASAPTDQFHPAVAATPGGNYLVAWADERNIIPLGDGTDILGAIVPAVGAAHAPFAIAAGPAGHMAPTVTAGAGGNFLVTWEDWRATLGVSGTPNTGVWGRIVTGENTFAGAEFAIAAPSGGAATSNCAAAATWNGTRWFVAYEQPCSGMRQVYSQPGTDSDVLGVWLSATGAVGNRLTIAQLTSMETSPSVAADAAGRVLVVWRDQPAPDEAVRGVLLADNATTVGTVTTFETGSGAHDAPSAVMTPDGHVVVSWLQSAPSGVFARTATPGLAQLGATFTITNQLPFIITSPIPVLPSTNGTAMAGWFRTTLPAAMAVTSAGHTLAVYNQADMLSDRAIPRVYFTRFGAMPNGSICGAAGVCSDGFCTSGQCCNAPCDGVCQGCGVNGCVETPINDARCGIGSLACAELSSACRTYSNPAMRCVAFGQCAAPGEPTDCTIFDDAPDGMPCSDGACASGSCMAGACVCASTLPTYPSRALPSGCEMARGVAPAGASALALVLLALVALRRRLWLLLAALAACGPPAIEVDIKLSDTILASAHTARLILSSTDGKQFPPAPAATVAPGVSVRNLDADGDGAVDIVVDLAPTYGFARDNRFRLEPVALPSDFRVSVRAEILDAYGNRFARLGGALPGFESDRVAAQLNPGQTTKLAALQPACLDTDCKSTWTLTPANAQQQITFGNPTALAIGRLRPDSTRDDLVIANAHHDAQVTGSTLWSNNGAVRVLYGNPQLANSADMTIVGAFSGDQLGASVAIADLDGDGAGELVIGAPGVDSSRGAVYVITRAAGVDTWPVEVDLSAPPASITVVRIVGNAINDRLGAALVVVDRGGAKQILAAAPGAARVYALPPQAGSVSAVTTFLAGPAGSELGRALAVRGNTVAIGAPFDTSEAGAGAVTLADVEADFAGGNTSALPRVRGDGGAFGAQVALLDPNADGVIELAVGAPSQGGGMVASFEVAAVRAAGKLTAADAKRTIRLKTTDAGLGGCLDAIPRGLGDVLITSAPGAANVYLFSAPSALAKDNLADVAIDDDGRPSLLSVAGGTAAPRLGARVVAGKLSDPRGLDLVVAADDNIFILRGPLL